MHGDADIETVINEAELKIAAAEIGAALRFSPISAQRRVCQAVDFAVDLPSTLRALEKGSMSLTIADRTQNLPVQLGVESRQRSRRMRRPAHPGNCADRGPGGHLGGSLRGQE